MSLRKVDLNKRTFFVISGISNVLGKSLTMGLCRRFKSGSLAMLIDTNAEKLAEVKKEIQHLDNGVKVVCCALDTWQRANGSLFCQLLEDVLANQDLESFELAFALHNEGKGATDVLIEPQDTAIWKAYLQENLYATVALNQEFLKCDHLANVEKLIVNISSSLLVKPMIYGDLLCSCKTAREMYFRSMAELELHNGVSVMTYMPGIMDTHVPPDDLNNNRIDVPDVVVDEQLLKLPRIKPAQSTLQLINILEDMSFTSGHDVDYYDTYVL